MIAIREGENMEKLSLIILFPSVRAGTSRLMRTLLCIRNYYRHKTMPSWQQ
jgi:hypothetical protein